MTPMPRVLVVDDERNLREGLVRALEGAGFSADGCDGQTQMRAALASSSHGCILLDVRLKDGDGLELLAELQRTHPKVPVVMATALGDSERTIKAMRQGAFDYLVKPFDLERLFATVARALRAPRPSAPLRPEGREGTLVGSSPTMLEVWKSIGRAARSDVPVLITGETGTGKELVARAIHEHGVRKDAPFVAVNVAALPAPLVEAELFGHEKGAFTGAMTRREGRFETASEGTLFLDEVADLDPALQTKLLRVLQDGSFERVGSQQPLRSQARILAATSRPVRPDEPGSSLRPDLYYRLGVLRVEVPPLRARRSDIPLLVAAFLQKRSGPERAVSESAMRRLQEYPWPGNVRELRHALERACVMSAAEVLDADDFELRTVEAAAVPTEPSDLDLHRGVAATERSLIVRALAAAGGNRAQAARLLGIGRPQLYAKLKEHGLESAPGGS